MPTRNRPGPLRAALEAIRQQSYRRFEAIVVDDGSDAACRAKFCALRARLDDRFQLVSGSPPGSPGSGPGTVRNRAIALARGEFIAFCDDDDLWCADDHLAVAAEALEAAPEADIYYANQAAYRGGELIQADRWPQLRKLAGTAPRVGSADVCRLPRAAFLGPGGTAHLNVSIVRRSLIQAAGGFWTRVRYEEDLDFYLRSIDLAGTVLYRPTIVARHAAPDLRCQDNASTLPDAVEKLLLRSLVCEHVRAVARTREVIARASEIQGYALRHLSTALGRSGQHDAALVAGAQALAVLPGLRWSSFLLYMAARQVAARLHRRPPPPVRSAGLPAAEPDAPVLASRR